VVEVRGGQDIRARLAGALVGGGCELLELRPLAMSLEDIFLELTARADGAPKAGQHPPREREKRAERRPSRANRA
jgi:hypothetical protein